MVQKQRDMKTKTMKDFELLKPFDRYEGERRTDIKAFDRTREYRGFKMHRNAYIPNGANGRWEVPELNYIGVGGLLKGFLTVSIIQSEEAIDKWFQLNEELNSDTLISE